MIARMTWVIAQPQFTENRFKSQHGKDESMPKKKVMILGAGECQIPIIKLAQRMGFQVIVVSVVGDYPGFSIADKAYQIDVRAKERILAVARQEAISAILTDQTDLPVPTVAYVAEQLGLPGIGCECALRFTNKHEMRRYCKLIGVPIPSYYQASSWEEAKEKALLIGFPCIIKPVDNQGSRGVAKVNDTDDLKAKFRRAIQYSGCNSVIIEEFFSGTEVVVQGFVSNYQPRNLLIGDRYYFDLPNLFIPKQTIFPSTLRPDLKQKVLDLNSLLIKSFAPKFGITHCEYLVNESSGEIRLVEAAIRGGGVFISSDLVPLACGVDVNEPLFRCALGENVSIESQELKNGSSAYVCFCLPEGFVLNVQGLDKVVSLPGVHKAHCGYIKPGYRANPIQDKTGRLGPILFSGKDRAECDERIEYVKQLLTIKVQTATDVKGIIW